MYPTGNEPAHKQQGTCQCQKDSRQRLGNKFNLLIRLRSCFCFARIWRTNNSLLPCFFCLHPLPRDTQRGGDGLPVPDTSPGYHPPLCIFLFSPTPPPSRCLPAPPPASPAGVCCAIYGARFASRCWMMHYPPLPLPHPATPHPFSYSPPFLFEKGPVFHFCTIGDRKGMGSPFPPLTPHLTPTYHATPSTAP